MAEKLIFRVNIRVSQQVDGFAVKFDVLSQPQTETTCLDAISIRGQQNLTGTVNSTEFFGAALLIRLIEMKVRTFLTSC